MSRFLEVLLTGGTGQIGWELRRALAPLATVHAPGRDKLALQDQAALRNAVRSLRPALVVNCAAFTSVDLAETRPDEARQINATAPAVLAEECRDLGIPLLHFSTDYVFDGQAASPRRELDPTGPLNVYGLTKLAGEAAVLGSGAQCLVVRIAWVYGLRGRNFLTTILRLARERDELQVVDDQLGAPTWSRMIAEAVAQILGQCRLASVFDLTGPRGGLLHLAAAGETSWYGFAKALLALDPDRRSQRPLKLTPIPTSHYPTPAIRPRYSVLDCQKASELFGVTLPSWDEQLRLAMAAD